MGFRAWADEYAAFKEIVHEMRTTLTAKLNELMREAIEDYKRKKQRETNMTYAWNEKKYQIIKRAPGAVAWKKFATDKARLEFDDYCCIANPHLIRGSQEYLFWQNYFNAYFGCRCTFPFIVRMVNSFMITGEQSK